MLDFCRLLTGSQGTMGIVTWASVKCEPLPKIHNIHTVGSSSLKKLCDFMFEVLRWRFSDEFMIINDAYLSTVLAENATEKEKIRKKLHEWQAIVGIVGREILPELRVKQQEADISDIAKKLNLNFSPLRKEIEGIDILGRITLGYDGKHWRESEIEDFAQIFFITTISKTKLFVKAMFEIANKSGYPSKEIGVYIQPQHAGTSCHCEFLLPYHANNIAQVRELFFEASAIFSEMGAYFARPYGIWAKLQFKKDPLASKNLETVKKIFDPKMIMNPGKLNMATEEVAK
jgi:FAD/FMN-containing dehydrogenase